MKICRPMIAKMKKENKIAKRMSTICGIDINITDTIAATPDNDLITLRGLNTRKDLNTFKLVDGSGVNARIAKNTTTKSNKFHESEKYGFGLSSTNESGSFS